MIARMIPEKNATANAAQKIAENITRPKAMRRPQLGLGRRSGLRSGLESLVNELHQDFILERFCKERKCSRIERSLAH